MLLSALADLTDSGYPKGDKSTRLPRARCSLPQSEKGISEARNQKRVSGKRN